MGLEGEFQPNYTLQWCCAASGRAARHLEGGSAPSRGEMTGQRREGWGIRGTGDTTRAGWPSFGHEMAVLPIPGSRDSGAALPTSEVDLGLSSLNPSAPGSPRTLLKALHREHTQFIAELLDCHGPPWRSFQRANPTQCPRASAFSPVSATASHIP